MPLDLKAFKGPVQEMYIMMQGYFHDYYSVLIMK